MLKNKPSDVNIGQAATHWRKNPVPHGQLDQMPLRSIDSRRWMDNNFLSISACEPGAGVLRDCFQSIGLQKREAIAKHLACCSRQIPVLIHGGSDRAG